MTAERKPFYTLEEYFALEKASEERYEYWDGQVFCMSGGSQPHSAACRSWMSRYEWFNTH